MPANEACFPDELAGASRVVFKVLTPNADRDCWKRPCLDIKCHASRYLVCAFKALADRSRPNLVVRDDNEVSFYLEIDAKIHKFGREHPGRRQSHCDLLIKLATLDPDKFSGDYHLTF